MSEAKRKEVQPTRLQVIRERGVEAIPALPKRGAQTVPIDRIIEDPQNERKTFRNMDGLIETVKAMGVIEPITVAAKDAGTYVIVTGHRRYRAAKAAGLAQLRVIVAEPTEDHARRQRSLVSNVQREDVPPLELAEALQALLDEDDAIQTQRDLAAMLGKREAWVSDMLRLLTLPAHLQQKLRTSEVSGSYDALMRIARVRDEALQGELVDDVIEGASSREIREKINPPKAEPEPLEVPEPETWPDDSPETVENGPKLAENQKTEPGGYDGPSEEEKSLWGENQGFSWYEEKSAAAEAEKQGRGQSDQPATSEPSSRAAEAQNPSQTHRDTASGPSPVTRQYRTKYGTVTVELDPRHFRDVIDVYMVGALTEALQEALKKAKEKEGDV